jgi:hypothetical protein
MNSLTNLGEFVGHCLPPIFLLSLFPHEYAFSWIVFCIAGSLDLSYNALTGMIPFEVINSLTNLGEFVGHCLPPIFFLSLCPHEYAFSWILLCIADELWLYNNAFIGNYTCPDFIDDCLISCYDEFDPACRSLG